MIEKRVGKPAKTNLTLKQNPTCRRCGFTTGLRIYNNYFTPQNKNEEKLCRKNKFQKHERFLVFSDISK